MKLIATIFTIFFFCSANANEIKSIVQVDSYSITNVDLIKEIQINQILRNKPLNDAEKRVLLKNLIEEKIKEIEVNKNNISINKTIVNNRVTQILSNYKLDELNQDKIKIINPGCNYPIEVLNDSKRFAKNIFGNASPKLITISRLDGRKSHHNILMTIKNLLPKYPKLKYVSIGDGDERDNLNKLKIELGLENYVNFIYQSTEQEKVGLLEQSDIFVMPSVVYKKSIEGFGISFIEAASYGIPSIGGIFGGESDAIVNGKTGYLCDGNDLTAIYETLLKTLDNNNHKQLGTNALEFSKNFSWNKIIKKYIELI